ncbi:MAG: hypothetical protein CMJ18_04035 [Phycisphaeraceae bacterium]|nr:hypothetical protein [Phycisphaeraceae bacterium]
MNICMVGYGKIATQHMEAFAGIDGVRAHTLVGRRPEPTRQFAERFGFGSHGFDLEAALADDAIDAVVITSPNEMHVLQAEIALRAGKHVLLEIPIAMTYDEAVRVTELSRTVDRRLMVCHTMRSFRAMREIRRRVREGELKVHQVVGQFGILRRTNTTADGTPRSWTDNILWHHAAHLVDLSLWFLGAEPREVFCRFGPPHPTQNFMDLSMVMTMPDGALVTITESYNISDFRWRATVIGEEATLEYREGTLYDGAGDVVVPHQSIWDLYDQNVEFVAAVREGRDPEITGESVLPTMKALADAERSALAT